MARFDLLVWELLCAALLYSVFCRLVHTSVSTRLDVRLSIFSLGLAALVGIGAPLYGWTPDVVVLCITVATVAMQLVAARHWRNGVPAQFICQKGASL
jgi:hypothetical protein